MCYQIQTHHLINEEAFAKMKDDIVLVNTRWVSSSYSANSIQTGQHKVSFIIPLRKFNSNWSTQGEFRHPTLQIQPSAVVRLSIFPPWSKHSKPRRCGELLLTFLRVKKSEPARLFSPLPSEMRMYPGTYFTTSQRVVSATTLFWAGWQSLTMSSSHHTSPSTQIRWGK